MRDGASYAYWWCGAVNSGSNFFGMDESSWTYPSSKEVSISIGGLCLYFNSPSHGFSTNVWALLTVNLSINYLCASSQSSSMLCEHLRCLRCHEWRPSAFDSNYPECGMWQTIITNCLIFFVVRRRPWMSLHFIDLPEALSVLWSSILSRNSVYVPFVGFQHVDGGEVGSKVRERQTNSGACRRNEQPHILEHFVLDMDCYVRLFRFLLVSRMEITWVLVYLPPRWSFRQRKSAKNSIRQSFDR